MFKKRNSVYYSDKRIKKIRIIAAILFYLGVGMLLILPFIWKDEYSMSIENPSVNLFFKMPFIYFIVCFILFIISSIIHYIAVIKSFVIEFKKNDNSFLK